LVTTEPIETPEDIERVVDFYRARWLIEEFFKALESGCDFEGRQLETRAALLNALALFSAVAWRLLLLRSLAREHSDEPAEEALTEVQLKILRRESKRVALGASVTVREAYLAIAGLGGHLKRNGEPGWQTLGRGFEDLLQFERGWALHEEDSAM
jgi:hypothetical protein